MMQQYNIGQHLCQLLRQVFQNTSYSGINEPFNNFLDESYCTICTGWPRVWESLACARIPITGSAFNSTVSGFMGSKYFLVTSIVRFNTLPIEKSNIPRLNQKISEFSQNLNLIFSESKNWKILFYSQIRKFYLGLLIVYLRPKCQDITWIW